MSLVPRRWALLSAVLIVALATALLSVARPTPAAASTTDAAFNASTGALNVNYGAYLAKHDIVYNTPNTNPLYGLTVGNGNELCAAGQPRHRPHRRPPW